MPHLIHHSIIPYCLHSGRLSNLKIDCDALTDEDLDALAAIATYLIEPFDEVIGIPMGGLKFAQAMRKYSSEHASGVLIIDDVLTTGGSMNTAYESPEAQRRHRIQGLVIFARGPLPTWVTAIFTLNGKIQ